MREHPDVALVDVRMPGGGAARAWDQEMLARDAGDRVHGPRRPRDRAPDARSRGGRLLGQGRRDRQDRRSDRPRHRRPGTLSAEVAGEVIESSSGSSRRPPKRDRRGAAEAHPPRARGEGPFQHGVPADLRPAGSLVGTEALARFHGPPAGPVVVRRGRGGRPRRELELAAAKVALAALPSLPPEIYSR